MITQVVLGKFSNQCSVLVREIVPITYENWKDVPEDSKEHVWKEMLRQFMYPENANIKKCRGHVMFVVGKALRNFMYKLDKEFLQKGRTPFLKYTFVENDYWEAFARQRQTPEPQAKSEQFIELAKRNQHHHHMGMTGYAGKKPGWRAEERAQAEAG